MGDDICAMDDAIFSELESESIEIIREVAATASQAGDAVFDRQRLFGDAAPCAKGVLPRSDPVSVDAHRYRMEVPGDDCVPGPHGEANRF